MAIPRTPRDPTRPIGHEGTPPTFVNLETHWWDASQIYGSAPAFAQYPFMRDSAMSHMDKEDMALLIKNYTAALDQTEDGHTATWLNPKTGHSGTATPLRTMTQQSMRCRVLQVTNQAQGVAGSSEFTFCKTKDGWKIAN